MRNVDCIDGTPLVDIKPYFASTDSFPMPGGLNRTGILLTLPG